jgi:hypothetical protein
MHPPQPDGDPMAVRKRGRRANFDLARRLYRGNERRHAQSGLIFAARNAAPGISDHLCATRQMAAIHAHVLVSTCSELRIFEIVDQPNWAVCFYFPRCFFELTHRRAYREPIASRPHQPMPR